MQQTTVLHHLSSSGNGGTATATALEPSKDYGRCLELIREYEELPTGWIQDGFDRLAALAALVLTAPMMLVIGLIIKLDSPGPALFRQYRVGRGGKLFLFTKFRTYYADARERFPQLYDYRISNESLSDYRFKVPNDPRATRVGIWLRKSTLDELPNFWHVLTGEMALVGPRPEIPEFLPNYTTEELRMFSVKPGVTGLAQISGRGWLTFPETCDCNLRYLKLRSFGYDLKILALTVYRVVLGHGAF